MGSNPMQKMKRNSILTGIVIGLVISLAIGMAAYVLLGDKLNLGKKEEKEANTKVYVLNKEVKAGVAITYADLIETSVPTSIVPATALNSNSLIENVAAKVDLPANTVITSDMLTTTETNISDDLRLQEYNMIVLPTNLAVNDYVDIRILLSNGADYIVVSKKKVENCNATTVWLNMYEEEIDLLSNAIIEYYVMPGSKLYITTYTDPGIQEAATGTYVPCSEVANLIVANPNIKTFINSSRYSDALKAIRNSNINSELNKYADDRLTNIEDKMAAEIEALQQSRQTYFGQLGVN